MTLLVITNYCQVFYIIIDEGLYKGDISQWRQYLSIKYTSQRPRFQVVLGHYYYVGVVHQNVRIFYLCTRSGSLRFSQFSGCWLILSVYILTSFDFPFVRLFGVRQFCYYPYLHTTYHVGKIFSHSGVQHQRSNNVLTQLEILVFDLYIWLTPENCENRNDPDLVQAFLKKWWVESDFIAPWIYLKYCSVDVK
jgi:hypothetical protein